MGRLLDTAAMTAGAMTASAMTAGAMTASAVRVEGPTGDIRLEHRRAHCTDAAGR